MDSKEFKKNIEMEMDATDDLRELHSLEYRVDQSLDHTHDITRLKKESNIENAKKDLIHKIYDDLKELFQYSDLLLTDKHPAYDSNNVYGFVEDKDYYTYRMISTCSEKLYKKNLHGEKTYIEFNPMSDYDQIYVPSDESEFHNYVEPLLINWDDTVASIKRGTAKLIKNRISQKIENEIREENAVDTEYSNFCKRS